MNRVLPKPRRKRRTRARVHPTLRSRKCPIVVRDGELVSYQCLLNGASCATSAYQSA